jgi:hypothetical protein
MAIFIRTIDFNSKTSTLEDCIIPDQHLLQLLNFSENDELIKDLFDHENLVKTHPIIKLSSLTHDISFDNCTQGIKSLLVSIKLIYCSISFL